MISVIQHYFMPTLFKVINFGTLNVDPTLETMFVRLTLSIFSCATVNGLFPVLLVARLSALRELLEGDLR